MPHSFRRLLSCIMKLLPGGVRLRLFYQQKMIGKKSRKLQKIPFTIEEPVHTLKDLLKQLVTQEVHNYNEKAVDTPLHIYITDQQLEDTALHGKVHFGEKKMPLCSLLIK